MLNKHVLTHQHIHVLWIHKALACHNHLSAIQNQDPYTQKKEEVSKDKDIHKEYDCLLCYNKLCFDISFILTDDLSV